MSSTPSPPAHTATPVAYNVTQTQTTPLSQPEFAHNGGADPPLGDDLPSLPSHLPEHFRVFQPSSTNHTMFTGGEESFRKKLLAATSPYGINRFVIANGSKKNHDPSTNALFPRHNFTLTCGACKPAARATDCCGFSVSLLLHKTDESGKSTDEPYLEVRQFKLPTTSRHILVPVVTRDKFASSVITNEDQLTPRKESFLKSMDKNRAGYQLANKLLSDQFDSLQIGKDLANRVMKKGRKEAWGADDDESMLIFYANGMKIREHDEKYNASGVFQSTTCAKTSRLLRWVEQLPLEVVNARAYGGRAHWDDTTHNATKYTLKTGPVSVCDWAARTAPSGLYQVREEEIESCFECITHLGLDIPYSSCCTDGGSAWPAIVEAMKQFHIEDTFHNNENAIKKMATLPAKVKELFSEMRTKLLFSVMSEEKLAEHIVKMKETVNGHTETTNWINRIEANKERTTATYSTKYFCCSDKGAASRCEVSMSRLKDGGRIKGDMRQWTLPELQHRHSEVVSDYETAARNEIKDAIKNGDVFSPYVVHKETEEFQEVPNLCIVETTANAINPFHGVLQSSKKTTVIYLYKSSDVSKFGIVVDLVPVGDGYSVKVDTMRDDCIFANTELEEGMLIHAIDGEGFQSLREFVELLKKAKGTFRMLVDTVPATGTIYKVARQNGGKYPHTVFIPDLMQGKYKLHCQSDFHMHTAFWIRDRYIQRALMEHPTRNMKDDTTMHFTWHITHSPLYEIEYRSLVEMMEIDGLGNKSLPTFLRDTPTTIVTDGTGNNNEESTNDEESTKKHYRFPVPTKKGERYNKAHIVSERICEMARDNVKVYKMIMPQLQQMYQNCVLTKEKKSATAKAAQEAVAQSKTKLPLVPEEVRRSKGDDENKANKPRGKKRKKTNTKKKE